jgi:hypothetical protein
MLSAEFFDKTYNNDRRLRRSIESNAKTLKVKKNCNDGTDGVGVDVVGQNNHSDLNKFRSPRSSKNNINKQRVSSSPFNCGSPTSVSPISTRLVVDGVNNNTTERRFQQYSTTTSTSMNCAAQGHSPVALRSAKKDPKGLTDLAINVSEAYRRECSSNKNLVVNNTRNHPDNDRPSRARTKQRDKKRAALHSSTNSTNDTNNRMTMYVNSDSLDQKIRKPVTEGQKNVRVCVGVGVGVGVGAGAGVGVEGTRSTPSSQDQRFETYNNYQSSVDYSPKGVDADTRGKELFRRKQRKTTDDSMGLLTIQDQIQLQDLYDEETRKNRDLNNIVSQHEDEISTLKVSLANVYNNGTKRQNDERINYSFGDKTTTLMPDDFDDASKNYVQKSSLRGEDNDNDPSRPKLSKDCEVMTSTNASRNLRQKNMELEESKQVIQMLFKDLKISNQNESESRYKLKSSRLTLQKNQLRYEENMRIAMKSADDVRANLKKLEQERSRKKVKSSAEVARINNELMEVRNECIRLKQQLLEQAQSSLATRQTQGTEEETDGRSERPADLEKETTGKISSAHHIGLKRNGDRIHCGTNRANQEEIASKQKENLEELPANENECSTSSLVVTQQQLPIAETSLLNANNIDITRRQQQSNFIPNSSFVHEETETLCNIPKLQNVDQPARQNTRGNSYYPISKNLYSSSSSFIKENNEESNNLSKRRLDFTDSDAANNDSAGITNFISPTTSCDSSTAHRSRSSNKFTLNELMKELEASKKRLETADKKLKGLVNDEGLLSTVRNSDDSHVNEESLLRTVRNSDDSQRNIGSIDIVDSLDDSIEVSHRSFAYV